MKICAKLLLLTLVFPAYLYRCTSGVTFAPCSEVKKNVPCNMTCQVPDLTKIININCNGSSRGSCTALGCSINTYQEGGNTVYLNIPSLSYSNDNCEWSCTYGATSSSSSTVTVFSGILSPLNLTSQTNADGVKLTAIADCLYPYYPIVDVEYSIQSVGPYASLNAQVDLQSSTPPGGCSDAIERRVTANFDVPKNHEDLAGKTVFFRMKFSQYQTGEENYTNIEGPFSFEDCSQDIFLYGFLPVFLIVLIASIPINILKIDFLSKQFGEFTWKKVGITAVFCVIAIIIGVCLGLLIKECDKKLLALGLSLFFGILLVVALIFALIYYHKKCESGSDIQDGDGGEDSCDRSSQNNTGSNTTRTGTGRVGSPASTSNVELAANLKSES